MLSDIIFENKDKFLAFQKCYKILEITYTIHTSSFLRLLRLEDPAAARLHRVATPMLLFLLYSIYHLTFKLLL